MKLKNKRLFRATYYWRDNYSDRAVSSGEFCVAALTLLDAVPRVTSAAKKLANEAGCVYLRVRSIEDQGVIR